MPGIKWVKNRKALYKLRIKNKRKQLNRSLILATLSVLPDINCGLNKFLLNNKWIRKFLAIWLPTVLSSFFKNGVFSFTYLIIYLNTHAKGNTIFKTSLSIWKYIYNY